MKNMRKWMLGAAVVAGGLGLGTTAAQAAEFGVFVRGPVAYVPPCPGAGYVWTAGYQANGYWVPGRWDFRGGLLLLLSALEVLCVVEDLQPEEAAGNGNGPEAKKEADDPEARALERHGARGVVAVPVESND